MDEKVEKTIFEKLVEIRDYTANLSLEESERKIHRTWALKSYGAIAKIYGSNSKIGQEFRNLAKLNPDDTTGVEVTGGYIIQVDRADDDDTGVWRSSYPTNKPTNQRMQFKCYYPQAEVLAPQQEIYIQNFMYNFETALYGANFKDPDEGYQKYINVGTFVDFFLLIELSNEIDGYSLSKFMHKDKDTDGGKLSMGPIWDFNIGLGNHFREFLIRTDGWRYARYGSKAAPVIWFYRLLEDDFF